MLYVYALFFFPSVFAQFCLACDVLCVCSFFDSVGCLLWLLFLCLDVKFSEVAHSRYECDVFSFLVMFYVFAYSCFAWAVLSLCSFFVWVRCFLCFLFRCLSEMFSVFSLSLFEWDVFCVFSFFGWVRCFLCLHFICLIVLFKVFALSFIESDVYCVCSLMVWASYPSHSNQYSVNT